jgi:hypothetical protein
VAHRGRENADPVLIANLAAGMTTQDAARAAGVGERTVTRRLSEEGFRRRVREARDALIAQAVGKLADAATEASQTLRGLLGTATPPAVRLGAARSILEMTMKLQEHHNHAERIAALERELTNGR